VFSDGPDETSGTRQTRNTSQTITAIDSMIRILSALTASAFAMLAASCCCTSDTRAPGLRPLPQFQELPAAPAPEVHYSK
jgi:hypothetical protein